MVNIELKLGSIGITVKTTKDIPYIRLCSDVRPPYYVLAVLRRNGNKFIGTANKFGYVRKIEVSRYLDISSDDVRLLKLCLNKGDIITLIV